MDLIGKIIKALKFRLSFVWKGNQKKIVRQSGNGLQIYHEQQGTTNIIQIENFNVSAIERIAGADIPSNPAMLLGAAGERFLAEQRIKQENLKTTVQRAELGVIENPQTVEKDWFMKWMEISQAVSRENMQELLARILAGEMRHGGSFSVRALDIVKNLSQKEVSLFQSFCDISYSIPQISGYDAWVICEPYGNPGNNGMLEIGLSYPNLTTLQDAGLIQGDLNAWKEFFVPAMFQVPFALGNHTIQLQPSAETNNDNPHINVINFTSAGLELRSVLNLGTNEGYNQKFLEWAESKWHMVPGGVSESVPA